MQVFPRMFISHSLGELQIVELYAGKGITAFDFKEKDKTFLKKFNGKSAVSMAKVYFNNYVKKNKEFTRVKIYMEETGDLLAVFVDELYDGKNPDTLTCYVHMGQHSPCSKSYLKTCKRVQNQLPYSEDWKTLVSELESVGYNLYIM